MIVTDTETTGLVELAHSYDFKKQPHLCEYAGIKLDDETLEETGRLIFRCKPPIPMPIDALKIHHITDEALAGEKPFPAHVKALQEFHLGEKIFCAHNAKYDTQIIKFELMRLDMDTNFPWPIQHLCTVEKTIHLKNHRLKLAELHQMATGEEFIENAHSGLADVEALVRVVRWLREKGII